MEMVMKCFEIIFNRNKETIFVSVSMRYEEKRVQKLVPVRGLLIPLVMWRQVSVIFFATLCYMNIMQYCKVVILILKTEMLPSDCSSRELTQLTLHLKHQLLVMNIYEYSTYYLLNQTLQLNYLA